MSDETTEKLRDAVIEAARAYAIPAANGDYQRRPDFAALQSAIRALDEHLKPNPLREAVALLRLARDGPILGHIAAKIDAFLAAQDTKDGASRAAT